MKAMSLWDYFAAAALAGALANEHIKNDADVPFGYAKIAAEMADAMMIERSQRIAK